MGTQSPVPKNGWSPPIFGPSLLWPNSCMDQNATWYVGRCRPTPHCVRWGPSSPSPNGAHPPNFRPVSIVAKRLDGLRCHLVWTGGRPWPRQLCVRWGPSYPQKKWHTYLTQFLDHVYCCKTAGWIKTPLGMEVDLSPGHIVLNMVPALRERGTASPPSFRPCLLWPRSPISATAELLFLSCCKGLVNCSLLHNVI